MQHVVFAPLAGSRRQVKLGLTPQNPIFEI
jgi:hypothetical protein